MVEGLLQYPQQVWGQPNCTRKLGGDMAQTTDPNPPKGYSTLWWHLKNKLGESWLGSHWLGTGWALAIGGQWAIAFYIFFLYILILGGFCCFYFLSHFCSVKLSLTQPRNLTFFFLLVLSLIPVEVWELVSSSLVFSYLLD